ncbi:hypothetical protein L1887_06149 [Cichorium endivia]|nr:hypothetical protein L1887_06149 [Cichorium endivia]
MEDVWTYLVTFTPWCLWKRERRHSADELPHMVNGSWDDGDDELCHEGNASWDDGDCEIGNQSDAAHGAGDGDVHDFGTLVSRPRRKVEKTHVQYDKKPKHVDVDALKVILWSITQELQKSGEEALSFKKILTSFLADYEGFVLSHLLSNFGYALLPLKFHVLSPSQKLLSFYYNFVSIKILICIKNVAEYV